MGCPLGAAGCALKTLGAAGEGSGVLLEVCGTEFRLEKASGVRDSLGHSAAVLCQFRAAESSASSFFSRVSLDSQKDTDDPASVGVGKKWRRKRKFFPGSVQIWRRGTGRGIWGSVAGAQIEAGGATVKSQCPSLPPTLQLPPEPLSGDQEKTVCSLQRGKAVSGQEKPLEVQRFCPEAPLWELAQQPRLQEQGRTMGTLLLASPVPIPNSLQSELSNLLTPSGKSAISGL